MKALVSAFNQEKTLVGAFSVIVQLRRLIVYSTKLYSHFIPDRKSLVLMLGGAIINLMAELFLKYLHAFKQIICEHWRNI